MWPPVGVVFGVCLMVEILLTVIPQVLPLDPPTLCPRLADVSIVTRSVCRISEIIG